MKIEPKTAFDRYYQKDAFDYLLESKAFDLPHRMNEHLITTVADSEES